MTECKRYYWLRLHDDIFESKRIKKLRRQENGDTLFVIYLKLQFKAMKHDGCITYDHIEDSFAEELALDIDEEADQVEQALTFFEKHDLCEREEDTYFFPYAVANVGSETASAQRQRDFRERHKTLGKCDNVTHKRDNVTAMSQSRNVEIEKEIEIEIKNRDNNYTPKVTRTNNKHANPFLTDDLIKEDKR